MNITRISFNPNGDSYTAIYIDNKLYKQGDEYHDSIHDFMEGFKGALEFLNIEYQFHDIGCTNENLNVEICEYADFSLIPDTLSVDFLKQLKRL